MSTRLADGGRLIDRARRWSSPSTANASRVIPATRLPPRLMANGQRIVGRSFKYHRPRGIVAGGAEEPNALVNLGRRRTVRAEPARHHDGAVRGPDGASQNHWPSLEWTWAR
jgi:sarcosine oxidase subunit alpha